MFEHIVAFFPEKCSILTGITTGTRQVDVGLSFVLFIIVVFTSSSELYQWISLYFSGDIVRGYDFIVNAVFPQVVKNLELKTPSIFAPGNPDVFHKVKLFFFLLLMLYFSFRNYFRHAIIILALTQLYASSYFRSTMHA